MLLSFARHTVRILPQVRLIRSQPAVVSSFPPISKSRLRKKRGEESQDEDEIIVGETVQQKFEKLPRRVKENLLENPSVMTLVHQEPPQHRVNFDDLPEPKVGYSDDELAAFDKVEEIKIDDALRNFRESTFDPDFLDTVGPTLTPTYNIAALADKHEVVRNLIAMEVSVYKWDAKPEIFKRMINLSWKGDCEPKIVFLVNDCRVEAADLKKILSRNPCLLAEDMQHLEARLEFLRDKKVGLGLRRADIQRVVSMEAFWLSTPVESIENRINFFSNQFDLSKQEFKKLIVSRPQIIMTQLRSLVLKKFSMIEEMGFSQGEIKQAIRHAPKILTLSRRALVDRFQVLHLDLGYDHKLIASNAKALYSRGDRIRERHAFLKKLGRAQYDNLKPGYISPTKLVSGSDEHFVDTVAKSTKEAFENFIKTL